ncbi:MAG TPA: 2-oxoglutarate dehydrogenase complex dihydrolipoyllysine-residue succinyltransferase [Roseiflexaceae bacterium]|nr:2-oxoglutarate dehydrogenase complex dihydrolipoyllysine-residue succinyltransferase [Roseiflexaceae bacterium]
MAVEIRVPALGESIVEATVGKWHKSAGENVAAGEALVELETDKVNIEVTAESAGVLGQIAKREGENVAIGDVLGTIESAGAAETSAPPAQAQPDSAPAPAPPAEDGRGTKTPVTPVAQRIASDQGVDVRDIAGSGPGGRVTKDDVVAQLGGGGQGSGAKAAASPPPTTTTAKPTAAQPPSPIPQPPAPDAREERIRMSRRRQTIAARLVEAQRVAAMLTTFNEIDMSAVMEVRKRRRDSFKERHGVGLGFMSFFTRATIGALKAFPLLNAEIQGDEIVVKHYYDIGIAVGTDEGLVVPVLRDADRKSFAQIEREIADLAARARDGELALAELQGGSFTITNGGIYGSLMSTPILNTPQVGILGMHKIEERPIALGGQVVIRPMMYVALSYDHRIVDGSEAVRFLVRIKELVEDPEALLLEG